MQTKILTLLVLIIISTSCKTEGVFTTSATETFGIDTNEVFIDTEVTATYKGGATALTHFVRSNFVYPKEQHDSQTITMVKFIVNRQGKVTDAIITGTAESQYTLFDKEAIRVVKAMTAWSPAIHGGIMVKQSITIPIQSKIK